MKNVIMHTFESLDRDEVVRFFEETKPEVWETYTRRDIETLQTVYGLKWTK